MDKFAKRIGLIYLIICTAEIVITTTICLFYFFDVFGTKEAFKNFPYSAFTVALILFNSLIFAVSYLSVFYIRKKTDLRASDLIGADGQEVYNFGMLGIIITNEEDDVLWISDLLINRNIDILNTNIFKWCPKLKPLKGDAKNINVTINSKNYEVEYLKESKMFIFKDITDFVTLKTSAINNEIVVGLIIIDNFFELNTNANDDVNSSISKIRNAIFEYAKTFKLILRSYKNDAYFVTCTFSSLNEMMKDEFKLLNVVRNIGKKEITPPTLSISFAYGFPDVNKLNEMANDGIEIAMSRGGDQVVVSKYGSEIAFYGGKSEALETRNKVKVRVLADSLVAIINNSKKVFVIGHSESDMDSVGSSLGILALCEHLEKPCKIVYDPKLTEKKARGAMIASFSRDEINKISILPKDLINAVDSNTLIIMVDNHRPSLSLCPKLFDKTCKIAVIDHHRRSDEYVDDPLFSYIEPSASSASELICELLRYCSLNPRPIVNNKYATIMLSGIFLDSQFYKTKTTGIRTFEASMILKEFGASNSDADDFLKDEFEEYTLVTEIASTLKTPYVGIVYCVSNENNIVDNATLAKVANQCMQMKGVNAAFVIGKCTETGSKISCRSDGKINVQLIAEKMGGGGHFTSAAVFFKNKTVKETEVVLLNTLDDYIKKNLDEKE